MAAVSTVIRAATEPVRVTMCAATRDAATDAAVLLGRTVIVELPALTTRPEEHDRLILAYAADAVVELGAPPNGFREHELEWLRRAPIDSLAELEELGRRIVAVRNWGVSSGASRHLARRAIALVASSQDPYVKMSVTLSAENDRSHIRSEFRPL